MPFLGVCLGMQCAVAEFARNVCGMHGANSTEFDPDTPLPGHRPAARTEERARTWAAPCGWAPRRASWCPDTKAQAAYGAEPRCGERHRHRFEVNNDLRPQLEAAGLVISGTTADGRLVEIVELPDHPWFVASQFHPEFKSRPTRPAPLFRDFVGAAARLRSERDDELEDVCAQA